MIDNVRARLAAIALAVVATVASSPIVQELVGRIPQLPTGAEWAIATGVAVLVYARVRADERWFAPSARFWFPLRRYLGLPLDRALEFVPLLYAKTSVYEKELVATVGWSVKETNDALAAAGYEPQPLASVAVDWLGRVERSSWVRYYGPKPLEGFVPQAILEPLPEWTRRRQVHARPFGFDEEGPMSITAHDEFNPWRPMLALPHMLGITWNADDGVEAVREDLDIEDAETELDDIEVGN
jgi:hypothetical protein